VRRLTEADIPAWVDSTLLSPTRTLPIVAVTSHPGSDRGWIDPEALAHALANLADVVFLETGDPTWALADALPPLLDVYGGAVRIWWPGLTRESDPYAHRLYFVRGMADAARVQQVIVDSITACARAGASTAPPTAPAAPAHRPAPLEAERVRVTALARDEIQVASDARRGKLQEADLPIPFLAELLVIGCELEARPARQLPDGQYAYSAVGLLPDPWRRFVAEVKAGDVVTGRVQNLHEIKKLVFVDVLPGVVGVCHVRELDYEFVPRLADFVQPGELLAFEVLEIDPDGHRLQLSRKRAFGATPRSLPPLFDGGRPFVWKQGMPWFGNLRAPRDAGEAPRPLAMRGGPPTNKPQAAPASDLAERVDELQQQLEAAAAERHSQVAQIRQLRQQLQDARKELRGLQSARRSEPGEDPLASERAFLQAVRVEYARLFDEGDRLEHPLQRMRVGREFLASLRAIDGIEVDKVVEVCAEVAAGIAHTKAGRDVHPLRGGLRGAGSRTRARDGAKAWRCALQVNSPSARRLHWWNVPGPEPRIEFARVCLHDDYEIPEE
jgi:hypothetical protein